MPYRRYHTVILPIRCNLQDVKYGCGPGALKIILETLGKKVSERKLKKWCQTTQEKGTPPEALIKVLKMMRVKFKVYPEASLKLLEDEINQLRICLVDYQAWGKGGYEFQSLAAGHYSVIFGYNKNFFYLADPAKRRTAKDQEWGFRLIRKDLFVKRWRDKRFNGRMTHHWLLTVPLV